MISHVRVLHRVRAWTALWARGVPGLRVLALALLTVLGLKRVIGIRSYLLLGPLVRARPVLRKESSPKSVLGVLVATVQVLRPL